MKKLIISFFLLLFLNASGSDSLNKAAIAMKNGNYKKALDHINNANKTNYKNPDLYKMKALIHEILDEPNQAKKAWKKCLKYSTDENMNHEAKIHIKILSKKNE